MAYPAATCHPAGPGDWRPGRLAQRTAGCLEWHQWVYHHTGNLQCFHRDESGPDPIHPLLSASGEPDAFWTGRLRTDPLCAARHPPRVSPAGRIDGKNRAGTTLAGFGREPDGGRLVWHLSQTLAGVGP